MILSIALFIGLTGCFFSMLGWSPVLMGELFTGEFSLNVVDGCRLVLNQLFTVSEQQQLYLYTMFPISLPESDWGGNIAVVLIMVMVLFGLLSIVVVRMRHKSPVIIMLLLVIAVQVYFGVFPSAVWNIVLFSVLALIIADRRGEEGMIGMRRKSVVVALLAMVAMVVWFIYPVDNPHLREFSEAVRDRFGTRVNISATTPEVAQHIAGFEHMPEDRVFNVVDVRDETLHELPHNDYSIERDETAWGAEIGTTGLAASLLPLLLVIIAFAVIIAIIRITLPLLKVAKRRKGFSMESSSAAINNMFIYMLEWLAVHGLKRKNIVFSAYAAQLSELISLQYSQEYEHITALWQEAVYSSHELGEAERQHMKAFLDKTMGIVWRKSDIMRKFKIKFHYFL